MGVWEREVEHVEQVVEEGFRGERRGRGRCWRDSISVYVVVCEGKGLIDTGMSTLFLTPYLERIIVRSNRYSRARARLF